MVLRCLDPGILGERPLVGIIINLLLALRVVARF